MSKGLIYCVRNPLFPHLVKIGKTSKNSVEERGLNMSNVPEDFEIIFAYLVENIGATEQAVHNAVKEFKYFAENTSRKNEFYYACAVEKAESVVKPFKIGDYTESEQNQLKVAKDNIRDYPTKRYKEYVDLAKKLLALGQQGEFSGIRKIDDINRSSSTSWTKISNEYAVRTNHSTSTFEVNLSKLKDLVR